MSEATWTAKCEEIIEVNREVRCSGHVYRNGEEYAPIAKAFEGVPTVEEIETWLEGERDYYRNLNEGVTALQDKLTLEV